MLQLGPVVIAGMTVKYARGPDVLPSWASWVIVGALLVRHALA